MSGRLGLPTGKVRRVTRQGPDPVVHGATASEFGSANCGHSSQHRLLLRLLREPKVKRVVSLPFAIEWTDGDGTRYRHVPQYLVAREDGTIELHDIEYCLDEVSAARADAQELQRAEAVRRYYARLGWHYKVHLEATLPAGVELANLQLLSLYHARSCGNATVADATKKLLNEAEDNSLLVGELVAQLTADLDLETGVIVSALCHCLWHRILVTDLDRLLFFDGGLTPLAIVRLPP